MSMQSRILAAVCRGIVRSPFRSLENFRPIAKTTGSYVCATPRKNAFVWGNGSDSGHQIENIEVSSMHLIIPVSEVHATVVSGKNAKEIAESLVERIVEEEKQALQKMLYAVVPYCVNEVNEEVQFAIHCDIRLQNNNKNTIQVLPLCDGGGWIAFEEVSLCVI